MLTLEPRTPVVRSLRAVPSGRCSPRCALLCTSDGLARAHRRHASELLGLCTRLLRDRGLAEDVTQEVFLRAWRACARFEDLEAGVDGAPGRGLRAWLFTVARNAVIDAIRRRDRRPPLHGDPDAADQPDPRDGFTRYETAELVHGALTQVSDQHRAVLVAVFLDGLDHHQVARRLGIPVGTVKSRVHYGLRALRAVLDETTSGPGPDRAPARCA